MKTESQPPNKTSLKTRWNHFLKKDVEQQRAEEQDHKLFGKPLRESLRYANVKISTANANGELYVWGYIPVVIAKCGLYLKENATEVQGTFRVNGSDQRIDELQAVFETPPQYGKSLKWAKEHYTSHDVASVFRRYLTQMPEPVIPQTMYHDDALEKKPWVLEEIVATYQRLIRSMPLANQYLLLYVLDLFSVFARRSDVNLVTPTNLAVIFQPALLSHPDHKNSLENHVQSQQVLEFLIAQQDWFMLDVPRPLLSEPGSPDSVEELEDDVDVSPSSDDNGSQVGGRRLAGESEKSRRPRRLSTLNSIGKLTRVLSKSLISRERGADNKHKGGNVNTEVTAQELHSQPLDPQPSMGANYELITDLPSEEITNQEDMIQQPSEVANDVLDFSSIFGDLDRAFSQIGKESDHSQPSQPVNNETHQPRGNQSKEGDIKVERNDRSGGTDGWQESISDRDLPGAFSPKEDERPQLSSSSESHAEPAPIPSDLRPKLYQNLLSLLFDVLDTQAVPATEPQPSQSRKYLRLSKTLQDIYEPMLKHDDLMSLVQSHDYRIQLLKFSSRLGIREHPRVRQALADDEGEIFNILRSVIRSDEDNMVLRLDGNDAETFMNLIQRVLNGQPSWSTSDPDTYRSAGPLLVRLSKTCDSLPPSLFISGVVCSDGALMYGGGFADIFRAKYDGQEVALKRLRVYQGSRDRQKIHRMFCKEALIWKQLDHPNVLPFLGIDLDIFPGFMCMVSPWMQHGTIMAHLEYHGPESIDIDRCLYEIAQGIEYLHSQRVVHGDIRGANILIDQDWHARLADFGLTTFAEVAASTFTSQFRGTTRWMAPELHQHELFGLEEFQRTYKTDVFAFGCVCLEVYTGGPPFSEVRHDTAVIFKLVNGARPQRPSSLDHATRPMSDKLWALVESCWSQQIHDRPSMSAVVEAMAVAMV